jgi:hypothetical protein
MNTDNAEEYFRYLFELQKSGQTNMMGAGEYLVNRFGISRNEARETVLYWMANCEAIAQELNIEF